MMKCEFPGCKRKAMQEPLKIGYNQENIEFYLCESHKKGCFWIISEIKNCSPQKIPQKNSCTVQSTGKICGRYRDDLLEDVCAIFGF